MTSLAGVGVWVRRIVDVTLIALILVVLFAVALSKLAPLTGRQTIAVGGSSMEPAIHLGAAMVVAPVDPAALSVGDVVSMHVSDANAVFTHRIVAIVDQPDGRYVQTKGDANPDPDPTLVATSAIIGRVELSIPLMGFVLALLSVPAGVIFVLSLAATLLALAGLLDHLDPRPAGRRRVDPAASEVGIVGRHGRARPGAELDAGHRRDDPPARRPGDADPAPLRSVIASAADGARTDRPEPRDAQPAGSAAAPERADGDHGLTVRASLGVPGSGPPRTRLWCACAPGIASVRGASPCRHASFA